MNVNYESSLKNLKEYVSFNIPELAEFNKKDFNAME